jgi:hypothetical protein
MKYLNRYHAFIFLLIVISLLSFVIAASLLGFSHDYANYVDLYKEAKGDAIYDAANNIDIVFFYTAAIFGKIGLPFSVYLFFYSLISMTLKFGIICQNFYKNNKVWIFFVLYMTQLYWLHEYTQIRLSFALAFILWAIYGKSTQFRLFKFMVAILSHASVAIIIVAYYVALKISVRSFLILATLLTVVSIGISEYLVDFALSGVNVGFVPFVNKISEYAFSFISNDEIKLNVFSPTPMLQLVAVLISARRILAKDQTAKVEILLSIVGPLFFYCLSPIPIVATRFYEMFIIFFLILIARSWDYLGWYRLLIIPYIFLSLRSSFFSNDPIIYFFKEGVA